MNTLKNKISLVTGGGQGLGAAVCKTLAASGAVVKVADINLDAAGKVAAEICANGGNAKAMHLDVRNEESIGSAIEEILMAHDRLDVLINNAGTDKTLAIEAMSLKDWDEVLGTNLRGPFITSRSVLPWMRSQGQGHIVNIVSTAAKRAWPNASAYHASKWGLLGLTHALHVEARPHNIKVTALICGGMRTPFLLDRFPDIDLETLQDPSDVADTVRYVLTAPNGTVIPEIMALPMRETSWP
jgi:NAD(P)-dependent dehydrogenase (short-subunit alcohol dehydrogenase family)